MCVRMCGVCVRVWCVSVYVCMSVCVWGSESFSFSQAALSQCGLVLIKEMFTY